MIGSKFSRHFFNQSEVKRKPIVARACTFSRALCRRRLLTSNFDWFTGLSPSFLMTKVITLVLVLRQSIETRFLNPKGSLYLSSQFLYDFHFNQSVSRKLQVKILQLTPSCCAEIVWFAIPFVDVTALKQMWPYDFVSATFLLLLFSFC